MFRNMIYYNKKKIIQYSALVLGQIDKGVIDENSVKKDIETDYLLGCSEFEGLLKNRGDYYDFVEDNQSFSVKDIRVSSIIRVMGEIYVPEQFDMVHLINEYKPYVLSGLDYKNDEEKELVNTVFEKSTMKIPIFCELGESCDYWMGIGKVDQENLLIDYNELEDYEGKEVTIIARIESRKYYKDKPLLVYDIYKDFLGLNRMLRKQITSDNKQDFENITVEEDYLGLELLAIYD